MTQGFCKKGYLKGFSPRIFTRTGPWKPLFVCGVSLFPTNIETWWSIKNKGRFKLKVGNNVIMDEEVQDLSSLDHPLRIYYLPQTLIIHDFGFGTLHANLYDEGSFVPTYRRKAARAVFSSRRMWRDTEVVLWGHEIETEQAFRRRLRRLKRGTK